MRNVFLFFISALSLSAAVVVVVVVPAIAQQQQWSQSQPLPTFCGTYCAKTHSGPVQCVSDSSCFWSAREQSCMQRCASIPERSECGKPATDTLPDSTHCFWRNATSRCEPRCSFLEAPSECSRHLHCVSISDTVSDSTNITTLAATTSVASASLTKTVQRCVPRCSDITHQILDNLPLTQLPVEALRPAAELARICIRESAGECLFDPAAQLCVRSCATQYGRCLSSGEIAACNADRRCRFDVLRGHCTERCAAFGHESAEACAAFSGYKQTAAAPYPFLSGTWVPSRCVWQSGGASSCVEDCQFNFDPSSSSSSGAKDTVTAAGVQQDQIAAACSASFTGCFFSLFHAESGSCRPRCDRFNGNYSVCTSSGISDYCVPVDGSSSRCTWRCEVAFPRQEDEGGGTESSSSSSYSLSSKLRCQRESATCQWSASTQRCTNKCGQFRDDRRCAMTSLFSASFSASSATTCVFAAAAGLPSACIESAALTAIETQKAGAVHYCTMLAEHSCIAAGRCSWTGNLCLRKCSAAYPDKASCQGRGSKHCLWISGRCVMRCGSILMTDTSAAREHCAAEQHCEYAEETTVSGGRKVVCQFRCGALPGLVPSSAATAADSAAAACASVGGCTMIEGQRCVKACSTFSFSSTAAAAAAASASVGAECRAHAHCSDVFRSASSDSVASVATSCTASCSFAYSTPSSCTSDPNCFYSARQGCLPRCSRVSMQEKCQGLAHCIVVAVAGDGGATQEEKAATATAAGSKDAGDFLCVTHCRFHTDSAPCNLDPSCSWTSAPAVAGLGAGQCLQQCSIFNTSVQCNKYASLDCVFDSEKEVCRTRCDRFSGSSSRCAAGSGSAVSSVADLSGGAYCVYTGEYTGCRDRCVLAPSNKSCGAAGVFDHCYLDAAVNVSSAAESNITSSITGKKKSISLACKSGCATFYTSQSACEETASSLVPSRCLWTATASGGFCQSDVCAASSGDRQLCLSQSPICRWHAAADSTSGRCAFACSQRHGSNWKTCSDDPACEFVSSLCHERCSSLGSEECLADRHRSYCRWQDSSSSAATGGGGGGSRGVCVLASCALRNASLSEAVCAGSDKACFVAASDSASCQRACPTLSHDASACEAEPHCFFDYDHNTKSGCHFRCSVLQALSPTSACPTTMALLAAISGAHSGLDLSSHMPHFCDSAVSVFNGSSSSAVCSESCFVKSQSLCSAAPHCRYVSDAESPSPLAGGCIYDKPCRVGGFAGATGSAGACSAAHSLCADSWGSQCSVDCSRLLTAGLCYHAGVAPECVWEEASTSSTGAGRCISSCYHRYTNLTACHSDRSCFFSFKTGTCQDTCNTVHSTLPSPLSLRDSVKNSSASSSSSSSPSASLGFAQSFTKFCAPAAEIPGTAAVAHYGWSFCLYESDLDEVAELINNAYDTASISSNSSRCTESCDRRYTNNKALCSANAHRCTWLGAVGAGGSCATACARFKLQSDCAAQSHCFFDGDQCVAACVAVAAPGDKAGCTSQPQCDHHAATITVSSSSSSSGGGSGNPRQQGGCTQKCASIFCPNVCSSTPHCRFDGGGGGCVLNCTAAFFVEADCAAHSSCQWDAANSKCRDHCSRALLAAPGGETKLEAQRRVCLSDAIFSSHCVWKEGAAVPCAASCSAQFPASTCTAAAGGSDSCEVVLSASSSRVCLDKCSGFSGPIACSGGATGCSIYAASAGGGVCSRSCHLRAASTCATTSSSAADDDESCIADPATAPTTSVCRTKCAAARSGQECVVSPVYFSKLSVSINTTEATTTAAAAAAAVIVVPASHHSCEFFGGDFGSSSASPCTTACSTAGSSSACSALGSNCTWRATSTGFWQCRPRCSLMTSRTACEGSSFSSSSQANTALLQGVACAWNPFLGLCEESCVFLYGSKTACNADSRCVWSTLSSSCVTSCSRFETAASCAASQRLATAALSRCFWSRETSRCFTSCSVRYGGAILAAADSAGCLADSSCTKTSDGRCLSACHLFSSASECRTHSSSDLCVWSSVLTKCIFNAETESTPSCPSWAEPTMSEFSSNNNNGSSSSSSSSNIPCSARCRLFRGDDTVGCSGNCVPVSADFCERDCFSLFGANETACLSDAAAAKCMWDSSRKQCQMNCALFSGSSSAWCDAQRGQCVWRGHGTCVQSCESRFGVVATEDLLEQKRHDCMTLAPGQCSSSFSSAVASQDNNSSNVSAATLLACTDRCSLFSRSKKLCQERSTQCRYVEEGGEPASASCQTRCELHRSAALCMSGNSECDWLPSGGTNSSSSSDGGSCILRCNSYTSQSSCDAHSNACSWIVLETGKSGCRRSCSAWYQSKSDAAGCNAEAHCSSRNRPSAAPDFKCLTTCAALSSNAIACSGADNCVWLGREQRCAALCSDRMRASVEEMVSVKRTKGSSSSSSSTSSTSLLVAAAYCEADSNCRFFASDGACELKCDNLDYAMCVQGGKKVNRNGNLCMWDWAAQSCRLSCPFSFGHDRPGCDSLPHLCAWADGLGRCTTRCDSGGAGGASAVDCAISVDSAATCRWMETGTRDKKVSFSAFGWAQDPTHMVDEEGRVEFEYEKESLGERRRALLSKALGGEEVLPTSIGLEQSNAQQSCWNTSRVTVRVDEAAGSYDARLRLLGAVRRLSYSQAEAAAERAGVLNPVVMSAGALSTAVLNFCILIFLSFFFLIA